ncbi:hypothetical protein ACWGDX_12085 [Streptomyces sp. NPDC055025]
MITAGVNRASRPTAGALRLIESRSVDPTSVDVSGYVTAMYEHCPFLKASTARGMTCWTVYEMAPEVHRYSLEAELFHAAVRAAEWVRSSARRTRSPLACENIVVLPAGEGADADPRELMAWPHWALKHLYGPVGVMFGKFTRGVQEWDKHGRSVPRAPYSFLPVRSSVRPRDPAFLTDTPDLSAAVATADDDGHDVFAHMPCEWKVVREWASSLPAPKRR